MEEPTESNPETVSDHPHVPPIVRHAGRPEHSLFSILFMVILSAGALYAVNWSVQEKAKPVYSWDFETLTYDASEWEFPYVLKEQNYPGITCVTPGTGPGPSMKMDLDTDSVRWIRATVHATHAEDETPVPLQLEWYWASAEDVAEAGEEGWAFSTDRGVAFRVADRHKPNTYTARLDRHPRWKGQIVQGFIGVKFRASQAGPFFVRTLKIEFLE